MVAISRVLFLPISFHNDYSDTVKCDALYHLHKGIINVAVHHRSWTSTCAIKYKIKLSNHCNRFPRFCQVSRLPVDKSPCKPLTPVRFIRTKKRPNTFRVGLFFFAHFTTVSFLPAPTFSVLSIRHTDEKHRQYILCP